MSRQTAVPYCTVKGFRRALEVLSMPGLAGPVDRTTLVDRGISPHAVYPVLGALRYLGLLDESGRVDRTVLQAFLGDDLAARRHIVEGAYAEVLADVKLPVADREELDRLLVAKHDCAVGVAPFCSTFLLWLLAESGLPVAVAALHRRGRPPAHLAELSSAARTQMQVYLAEQRAQRHSLSDVLAHPGGSPVAAGATPAAPVTSTRA